MYWKNMKSHKSFIESLKVTFAAAQNFSLSSSTPTQVDKLRFFFEGKSFQVFGRGSRGDVKFNFQFDLIYRSCATISFIMESRESAAAREPRMWCEMWNSCHDVSMNQTTRICTHSRLRATQLLRAKGEMSPDFIDSLRIKLPTSTIERKVQDDEASKFTQRREKTWEINCRIACSSARKSTTFVFLLYIEYPYEVESWRKVFGVLEA